MRSRLREFANEYRYVLEAVARRAGIADPVTVDFDDFETPLLKGAKRGAFLPIDGVLIRNWDPQERWTNPGIVLGVRLHDLEGIGFAHVSFGYGTNVSYGSLQFFVVDRKDYRRLYRTALRCRRDYEPPSHPPILPEDQFEQLWKNTIGYLDRANLRRIRAYGGRAKRGLLLTGAPGNGKTMACRWIWQECRRRRWEWRLVTPDAYLEARRSSNAKEAVATLFRVEKRGVVFFDDMDIALRDRDKVQESDDQAVFLGALDGLRVNEGVVHVFTTNCSLGLIDSAFKRPGRIDLVLHFKAPDADLRRRLMARWHPEILASISMDEMVATTDGFSFAEVEELKNLLILHFTDRGQWNWDWALRQFAINRNDLNARSNRRVGFGRSATGTALIGQAERNEGADRESLAREPGHGPEQAAEDGPEYHAAEGSRE